MSLVSIDNVITQLNNAEQRTFLLSNCNHSFMSHFTSQNVCIHKLYKREKGNNETLILPCFHFVERIQ